MQLTQGLRWSRNMVPDREAMIYGDRVRTWGESVDRIARFASGLQRRGIVPGNRVAMLGLNSDRFAEALYAISWAGAVPVPFNTRWAKGEIVAAVDDSMPSMVMIDQHFREAAGEFAAAGLDVVFMDDEAGDHSMEGLIETGHSMSDAAGRGDELAAIFFTGGTTGRNKGVMLSHANLMSSAIMLQARAPYAEGTRVLYTPPLFHLAAAASLFGVTLVGGTHVFLKGFEPVETLRAIEKHQISALILVPTMINMLCETIPTVQANVASVRRVTYGASAISSTVLTRAAELFFNAQFVQGYGQTEAAPVITVLEHTDHFAGRLSSAGRPLSLVEIGIVDPEMRPRARGEVGEVVARGPNVMLGYWGLPDITKETIVNGWLRTGDAGYVDDEGYLYLVDRVKDMIVSGGENVYSAEVENALMRHPAIFQCAVIGVPDARWGERVHAVVQLREGRHVAEEELIAHCRELIAAYKSPKSFDFWARLPLSAAGKVLKNELRKSFWASSERNIG